MAEVDTYNKFAPVLESLNNNVLFVASTLESMLNLTQGIFDIQREQSDLAKENAERLRREQGFAGLEPDTPPPAPADAEPKTEKPEAKDLDFGSFGDILKALALAPFAFEFAKGFISAITDDLIEITAAGITGLAAMVQGKMNGLFNFSKVARVIGTTVSAIMDLPILRSIKMILTKLAWPLTLFMGAWEAVTSFMNTEGSFIEKFGAGVGGFFAEIIGAPLDLLKSVVAWVLNKFGFEGAAEALKSFSFSNIIRNIAGGLFDALDDIVSGVVAIFNGDLGGIRQVFSGIIDTVLAPINAAINFVKDIFGWGDPDEPFRLTTFVSNVWTTVKEWFTGLLSWEAITDEWNNLTGFVSGIWESVKSWFTEKLGFGGEEGEDFSIGALFDATIEKIRTFFTDLFDFLPSLDGIKNSLKSLLPSWLGGSDSEEDVAAAREELQAEIENLRNEQSSAPTAAEANQMVDFNAKTQEEYDADIRRLEEALAALPQGRRGGIIEAPETGAPVMLHGQEAIIPLDSTEGQSILARKTEAIERGTMAATSVPAPVIVTGGNTARGGDVYNTGGNTTTTTVINNVDDPTRSLRHVPV